jgi:hypothetical protein
MWNGDSLIGTALRGALAVGEIIVIFPKDESFLQISRSFVQKSDAKPSALEFFLRNDRNRL